MRNVAFRRYLLSDPYIENVGTKYRTDTVENQKKILFRMWGHKIGGPVLSNSLKTVKSGRW